jgi:hypothetical protein
MGLVTGAAMGIGATAARGRRREEPVPPEAGIAGLKPPATPPSVPKERIEPTFDVEPLAPQAGPTPVPQTVSELDASYEAGIAGLTPKAPEAPAAPAVAAAPAAPVAEEDQPAQDLDAMLQEALAATGADINTVNMPKAEAPVEPAPVAEAPAEQPPSTALIEEVLPETKPAVEAQKPTAAPTARTKQEVEAELKKLMLETIRDKTPSPERDARIQELMAEKKAFEQAPPAFRIKPCRTPILLIGKQ